LQYLLCIYSKELPILQEALTAVHSQNTAGGNNPTITLPYYCYYRGKSRTSTICCETPVLAVLLRRLVCGEASSKKPIARPFGCFLGLFSNPLSSPSLRRAGTYIPLKATCGDRQLTQQSQTVKRVFSKERAPSVASSSSSSSCRIKSILPPMEREKILRFVQKRKRKKERKKERKAPKGAEENTNPTHTG